MKLWRWKRPQKLHSPKELQEWIQPPGTPSGSNAHALVMKPTCPHCGHPLVCLHCDDYDGFHSI